MCSLGSQEYLAWLGHCEGFDALIAAPFSCPAQVAKSVEYVQAGTTHLVAAKRLQKNTRKWMCCALILLIIIAAAIAIPIALKVTK